MKTKFNRVIRLISSMIFLLAATLSFANEAKTYSGRIIHQGSLMPITNAIVHILAIEQQDRQGVVHEWVVKSVLTNYDGWFSVTIEEGEDHRIGLITLDDKMMSINLKDSYLLPACSYTNQEYLVLEDGRVIKSTLLQTSSKCENNNLYQKFRIGLLHTCKDWIRSSTYNSVLLYSLVDPNTFDNHDLIRKNIKNTLY